MQVKLEVGTESLQEVEAAIQELHSKWPPVDLTEEDDEKWREDLFKSEARPSVREEIRLVVDAEMRLSLHRSKVPHAKRVTSALLLQSSAYM